MANAPLIPKIPPLRTDIQEPQQSSAVNRPPAQGASNGANTASNGSGPQHRTSKEWYYYWSKVGEQVVTNTQTLAGLVTYGPHSGRPDPSTMPDGALAVESDRGVIYQNELIQGAPAWRYRAGTMWATMSPDQRPTDLGVNDSGFEYRTTDQPPRQFYWSGGYWVETTPVRYGTHANRLAAAISGLEQGMLWIETDRSNVIYENQGGTWKYVAGAMLGTISPDQRPTDLGSNDTGFLFQATDTNATYGWSGSAWVNQTPQPQPNSVLFANATAGLTITTTATDIPGASISLTVPGTYLFIAAYAFGVVAADNNQAFVGQIMLNGVNIGNSIFQMAATTGTAYSTIVGQAIASGVTAGQIAKLQAWKTGGTGTSGTQAAGRTNISATWISP